MTPSSRIKVVLAGNPNVGKSLIFSRLTGVQVITANYPGTTVVTKSGRCHFHENDYEIVDMPGLYSLDALSTAELPLSALLDEAGIIVNVIDATTLERNLTLTLQLLRLNKPMVVCLNIWDETVHKGIAINVNELERILGVPVVAASAKSGQGINDLVSSLSRAHTGSFSGNLTDTWQSIGSIVTRVQKLSHRHHTLLERLSEITLHPVGGLVTAMVVLAATFLLVRNMGEGLITRVMDPFFSLHYQPFLIKVMEHLDITLIRELLIGSSSDPLQSFGILTTGVYIAVVLVFPYFFSFYLLFGLLEDFGYLPRLAVVLDPLFHRLGLHGYSSIPVMLGLGCKVPALLATRSLAGRREKILTIVLVLMSAPCLPQTVMIVSMGMHYGIAPVMTIFSMLFLLSIVMNLALNRLMPGEKSDLFMEIPGYRIPSPRIVVRKLWTRIIEYAAEVFPMIIIGVCIIHVLDALHVLNVISQTLGRPIAWLLGLPREIASVMLLGFLRKDVSIALLAPFQLSSYQFIIAGIFMVLYLPCIAAFFTLVKESGIFTAMKITGLVFCCALLVGSLLHGGIIVARLIAG
jgi:ferrous iron transport protein B